jgi:hypothetical protein
MRVAYRHWEDPAAGRRYPPQDRPGYPPADGGGYPPQEGRGYPPPEGRRYPTAGERSYPPSDGGGSLPPGRGHRGGRSRRLPLVLGAVIVVLAGAVAGAVELRSGGGAKAAPTGPLGINVAPWDSLDSGSSGTAMEALLRAAGITELRYGGGSYSDQFDWQTDRNISGCLPYKATDSFTSSCSSTSAIDFDQFSQQARAIGADSLVTVNYGSGTPALAASWVADAAKSAANKVGLWEIGNETYNCGEVNNELAGPPTHFRHYVPATGSLSGNAYSCPTTTQGYAKGMATMAKSYAVNALSFMKAMKAADPGAVIGVPWAFATSLSSYDPAASTDWNKTVLATDGAYVGFVDAHYYPFSFSGKTGSSGNPSDAQVLAALETIPSQMKSIRDGLSAYAPKADVVIGETSMSGSPTTAECTPLGAVFAAGDALSWIAAGAATVDWWDMNNYGNTGSTCTNADFGMFTSSSTPAPETSYYGYVLASKLAGPGAQLKVLSTSSRTALGFSSTLASGRHAVAFLNLSTTASQKVTYTAPSGLSGAVQSSSYSAGNQNSSNSLIASGSTSVSSGVNSVTLPPESITVLQMP